MNYQIRRAIERYVKSNGPQDTRYVIALFANRFRTPKCKFRAVSHTCTEI